MNLCRETDIISEIKKRWRRLGHVERMPEEITVRKMFKNISEKKYVGKPRKRGSDDVENNLKNMVVRGW